MINLERPDSIDTYEEIEEIYAHIINNARDENETQDGYYGI